MELNRIKFLPKANAVADVYAKATGMPIVGELMVAAAGHGGEPTPPTPETVYYIAYGCESGTETSRGTGRQTGVVEDGYQEVEILTNTVFSDLVGQKVWFDAAAAVDDGERWPLYFPKGTATDLCVGFHSEEPTV